MSLALGGARTDGAPGNQVGIVLGTDQVQVLGTGGQPHLRQIREQLARKVQSLVDLEGVVQVRVIDQAFPADSGSGLLEIDPHYHEHIVGDGVRHLFQLSRVVPCGRGIMDGTGAYDHQHAVVFTGEDIVNRAPRCGHGLRRLFTDADIGDQLPWRDQFVGLLDAKIIGICRHSENPLVMGCRFDLVMTG